MHSQESAWSVVGVACEMNLRQCPQVKRKESKWSGMQFRVAQEKERARSSLASPEQRQPRNVCISVRAAACGGKTFLQKIQTPHAATLHFFSLQSAARFARRLLSLSALLYVGTSAMFVFCCDALSLSATTVTLDLASNYVPFRLSDLKAKEGNKL